MAREVMFELGDRPPNRSARFPCSLGGYGHGPWAASMSHLINDSRHLQTCYALQPGLPLVTPRA